MFTVKNNNWLFLLTMEMLSGLLTKEGSLNEETPLFGINYTMAIRGT